MRAAVLVLAVAVLAVGASALERKHAHGQQALEAQAQEKGDCDCGWANSNTCGNNDGSYCFQQCCYTAPTPTPAPAIPGAACTAIGGACGDRNRCGGSIVTGKCPGTSYCCVPNSNGGGSNGGGSNGGGSTGGGWDPTLTQTGVTTRYWDCCKPSCAWSNNVPSGRGVVRACNRDGNSAAGVDATNVCDGGGYGGIAYTCVNQQPFVSGGVGYGFVATSIGACCDCFELQFAGTFKKMIVQRTNTGGDLGSRQFDIQMPGGGFGIYNGCSAGKNGPAQWAGAFNWGATYGGVSSKAACAQLPGALQSGCQFRFDFVGDNPAVRFKAVKCPAVLTQITGCSN